MATNDNVSKNRKQEPGSTFSQPDDELVKRNTKHEQETADSRDHDKQSGKGDDLKKPALIKVEPGKP